MWIFLRIVILDYSFVKPYLVLLQTYLSPYSIYLKKNIYFLNSQIPPAQPYIYVKIYGYDDST